MSRHGRLLHFNNNVTATCPESGLQYQCLGGQVTCLDLHEEAPLPERLTVGAVRYDDCKSTAL
jgi:hypothetical protein